MRYFFSFLVLSFFLLFLHTDMKGQDYRQKLTAPKKHIIKWQPLYFIRNTFELGYERLNRHYDRSWELRLGVTGSDNGQFSEFGMAAELSRRFYVRSFARRAVSQYSEKIYQEGLFIAPFVRAAFFHTAYNYFNPTIFDATTGDFITVFYEGERQVQALMGGLLFGYQRTFGESFSLTVYAGGLYRHAEAEIQATRGSFDASYFRWHNGFFDRAYQGVMPRGGLQVGIAF
ncbi:MAG: hypothetical protein JJT94_16175 [Bernardetiaceae bacterium]|nr:hypothetical protein [Bernardetiaceae bacterium]